MQIQQRHKQQTQVHTTVDTDKMYNRDAIMQTQKYRHGQTEHTGTIQTPMQTQDTDSDTNADSATYTYKNTLTLNAHTQLKEDRKDTNRDTNRRGDTNKYRHSDA